MRVLALLGFLELLAFSKRVYIFLEFSEILGFLHVVLRVLKDLRALGGSRRLLGPSKIVRPAFPKTTRCISGRKYVLPYPSSSP